MNILFRMYHKLPSAVRSPYSISAGIFFVCCLSIMLFAPPLEKEVFYPQVFVVSQGENIRGVAENLRERGLINSSSLFILANYAIGGKILYGSYHFSRPKGVFFRARDLYVGEKNAQLHRIVIPEGSNLYTIAAIFKKHFPQFDENTFIEEALEQHGYLYPSTYFLADDDIYTADYRYNDGNI